MSEETCMIKDGNDYKYHKRKFVIFVDNKTFKVEQKDIYSLCVGQGKWSRIKPIELEIKAEKQTNTNQKLAKMFFEKGARDYKDKLYQLGIVQFTKGIKILGEDSGFEPFLLRGLSYSKINKHQSALSDFNVALKINPNSAEAYFARAETNFALRKYATAIGDYTKAIELNPNNAMAYNGRGKAYQKLGKKELANEDFAQAKKLADKK